MIKLTSDNGVRLAVARKKVSDEKLRLIYACRDRLTLEFHAGRLSKGEIDQLGLAKFYELAGVGKNFLNGRKYRQAVKPEIKLFIRNLKASTPRSEALHGEEIELRADAEDLHTANQRLRDIIHETRMELHAKRRVIKALSTQSGSTVVSLAEKRPP
ncbi:hypothetical protein ACC676_08855 [Rhizobium ruizarguesonis]